MTRQAAELRVRAALAPPLFDAVQPAAVATRRVEEELDELLRDLGLSARPVVQLEAADPGAASHLLHLWVDERRCRFPESTIADALAYVDGTLRVPVDSDEVTRRLETAGDARAERAAELLGCICRAACSAQPGILLPPTGDPALRAALDLGMSIADGDPVRNGEPAPTGGDPAEQLIAALAATTLDVHIDPAYMRVLTADELAGESFQFLRDGLFVELGLPLPPFHFRPDPALRPDSFALRINAVRTLPRRGPLPGTILVNDLPERLADEHHVDAEPTVNPATGQPGALVASEHKKRLEDEGLTTWTPLGFLILAFAEAVRRNARAFMTRDLASRMTESLGYAFPVLGDAARAHAPPDTLAPLLRELLLDEVSIRNMRRIVELLLRDRTDGAAEQGGLDRVGFIRYGLADAITHKAARGTATVVVYLLDPELEKAVAAHRDGTARAVPEERLADRLCAAVQEEMSYLPPTAQTPAILTQDDLRRPLRDLLRHDFPRMTILGNGDLPPGHNVQPVARITSAGGALSGDV